MLEHFKVNSQISMAMRYLEPVVVMESSVWVHGLPKKQALHALDECFGIFEEEGVLLAITTISQGQIIVGADFKDIEEMIKTGKTRKVNIRDISSSLEKEEDGATTVSATLFIAHSLGLPICLTGGIGGVHQFAGDTFDISADLYALANFPIVLISSGVKSVLNIAGTLEKLETLGIPVICYNTDKFPGFYSYQTKYPAPEQVESAEEIAEIYSIHKRLGAKQGILVANPIPESDSLPELFMNELTEKALIEATELGIRGKDVTPFLLGRLHKLTRGKTIKANISLLKENARLAAEVAKLVLF